MNDLERSYKAYASIQKEIDSLRPFSYKIDTTLFYEIAKLWHPQTSEAYLGCWVLQIFENIVGL